MVRSSIYFILFIVSALGMQSAIGQDLPFIMDRIPPSPTAASLSNYVLSPSSSFSGRPSVSIPLFTVSHRGLNIPIQLSYDASGVKVTDMASWVGMNWSLQAGGSITRILRKLPDEHVAGYLTNGLLSPSANPYFKNSYYRNLEAGGEDGEPDIFVFSFPGGSGKFVFDDEGNIQLISKEKLKIEGLPNDTNGFKITDASGTVYEFYQKELTSVGGTSLSGSFTYTSAWHLTKMYHPRAPSQEINFAYTFENLSNAYTLRRQSRIIHMINYSTTPPATNVDASVGYSAYRLSSITSPLVRVLFDPSPDPREDLTNGESLGKIKIQRKLDPNGASYTTFKVFSFCYDHTNSAGFKRLYLMSLQEYDGTESTSQPPYTFTYNSGAIPGPLSSARDRWNYYNGATSNANLMEPKIVQLDYLVLHPTIEDNYLPQEKGFSITGGNRTPSETHLKMGVLQKISYPTGGEVEFEYELNKGNVEDTEALFEDEINPYFYHVTAWGDSLHYWSDWDFLNELRQYELEDKSVLSEAFAFDPDAPFISDTVEYTINTTQFVHVSAEIINSGGTPAPGTEQPFARVQKKNGGTWETVEGLNFYGSSYTDQKYKKLIAGDYRTITYARHNNTIVFDYARLLISWVHNTEVVKEFYPGPGLRVKRIKEWDGTKSGKWQVRRFAYTKEDGKESGIIYHQPVYSYKTYTGEHPNDVYLNQSSQDQFNYYGPAIGYEQVTEYLGENGEYGKKVYEYQSVPPLSYEVGYNSRIYPFPDPYYGLYEPGALLKEVAYKRDGVDYDPISERALSYAYEVLDSAVGEKAGIIYRSSSPTQDYRLVHRYNNRSIWTQLAEINETAYDDDGVARNTQTLYTYETTPGHLQPTQKEVKTSLGNKSESIITFYSYPLDYAHKASPNTSGLVDQHIHNVPIEQYQARKIGSQMRYISGQVSKYNSSIAIYEPTEIWSWEPDDFITSFSPSKSSPGPNILLDTHYEQRALFGYDVATGTLQTQELVDGQKIGYLWDYAHSLPIAKITNFSTSTTYGYSGFEGSTTGQLTYASGGIKTGSSAAGRKYYELRTSPSQQVSKSGLSTGTPYIVSFWAKGSGSLTLTSIGSVSLTSDWKYYQYQVSGVSSISLSSSLAHVDEVRIHPVGSQMETYSYDILEGYRSINPVDGRLLRYEYDSFGRLRFIKDHLGNIQRAFDYKVGVDAN
ncbi:hypothetical protein [Peijinzhouia sedimentorum]